MRIDITTALKTLTPTAMYTVETREGVDTLIWEDANIAQPTTEEIDAEVVRLTLEYTSQEYARARKEAYNLLNQDEMRFDDVMNNTTTWQDAILAIKAEFPKETI